MVTLFISHIWDDSYNTYAKFVAMLESVPTFHWQNLSINESQAVAIWQDGENAHRQKLELHEEASKSLASQIDQCYKRIKQLDDLATLEQRIANHEEATKRRLHDLERRYAGEMMIEWEIRCAADDLVAMKRTFDSIDVNAIAQERAQLYEFVVKLENERSFQRQCIDGLESVRELQSWDEEPYAIMGRNAEDFRNLAIRFEGKIPRGTVRHMNANLALILNNRIGKCDVLVVLAEMFAQYRRWCEFEFETAWNLRKPIVAVLPPQEGTFPREIVRRCSILAPWDVTEIIAAIQRVAPQSV